MSFTSFTFRGRSCDSPVRLSSPTIGITQPSATASKAELQLGAGEFSPHS